LSQVFVGWGMATLIEGDPGCLVDPAFGQPVTIGGCTWGSWGAPNVHEVSFQRQIIQPSANGVTPECLTAGSGSTLVFTPCTYPVPSAQSWHFGSSQQYITIVSDVWGYSGRRFYNLCLRTDGTLQPCDSLADQQWISIE
jgi:hypothetical protein